MATRKSPSIEGITGLRAAGQEGSASVYRGTDTATEEAVEVLVFAPEVAGPHFDEWAGTLHDLGEHPNILPVLTSGSTGDGAPYLVVPSSQATLGDRMASGPQPWHDVAGAAIRVASALESAHRAGLHHGNLTPASVRLSAFGDPQVGGFLPPGAAGGDALDLQTLGFRSPSRIEDQPATAADDVYAIGALIVGLATGSAPFSRPEDKSIVPVVKRVAADPVPDLRAHGVPEQVAVVVERAMAKTPGDRFSSVGEFGRALQQVQVALGVPVTEMIVLGERDAATPADAPTVATPVVTPPPPPGAVGAGPAAAAAVGGPPSGGPPAGPGGAGGPGGGGGGEPKKKTGLLVGAALLVLVLLGAGVAFAMSRGGDEEEKPERPSALDRIDIDEEEDDDEEPSEPAEPAEPAEPVSGQAELSEQELLAARLASEDLPEGFAVFEENNDPIEDIDFCGVEVDLDTLVGQRSISYQNATTGDFVVSTVAQFTGTTAEQYLAETEASLETCEDDEARIVDSGPADLGDGGLVVQLVLGEGTPEQVHAFLIFFRFEDTVGFVGHVIPSTEATPPTQLSGELAGRAALRLDAVKNAS